MDSSAEWTNLVINLERRRRILAAILISSLPQRRRRRWWIRPISQRRIQQGVFNPLSQEMRVNDVESQYRCFHMCKEHFDKLLTLVGPRIQRQNTNFRQAISPSQRLAITLRFLATGESYSSLSLAFRCGKATVGQIIPDTAAALWDVLWPVYMPVPNQEKWSKVCDEFWEKWQFPMCLGAMDGKHVHIQSPPNTGSTSSNCKDSNSIVLLALCDADYKYIVVDVGAYGNQSDVFGESSFGKAFIAGNVNLPPENTIPGTNVTVPPVIVADEAFPLLRNLMRPFPENDIKGQHIIYNRRLSRARRISENVFGVCCAKWKAMLDTLYMHPDNAETIVKSICVLHNYIRVEEAAMEPERRNYCPIGYMDMEEGDGSIIAGRWRQEVDEHRVRGLNIQGSNNYSETADQTRETFVKYFSSNEGKAHFVEK